MGLPMVLLETRHAAAAMAAQRNKTDGNDARGLAQLVRSGWFKPVHVKSHEANRIKLLLAHRRTLERKLMDIKNEVHQSPSWGRSPTRHSGAVRLSAPPSLTPPLSGSSCR
jgi:transposase